MYNLINYIIIITYKGIGCCFLTHHNLINTSWFTEKQPQIIRVNARDPAARPNFEGLCEFEGLQILIGTGRPLWYSETLHPWSVAYSTVSLPFLFCSGLFILQALHMKHRCQKPSTVRNFSLVHVHKSHSPNLGEEGSGVVQKMESVPLPLPAHPPMNIIYVYEMAITLKHCP